MITKHPKSQLFCRLSPAVVVCEIIAPCRDGKMIRFHLKLPATRSAAAAGGGGGRDEWYDTAGMKWRYRCAVSLEKSLKGKG